VSPNLSVPAAPGGGIIGAGKGAARRARAAGGRDADFPPSFRPFTEVFFRAARGPGPAVRVR